MGCIKDFYVASYFCQEVKSKGGCLILVREGIDSVAINVDGFNKEQCCEIACISVCDTLVGCVYRSPLGKTDEFLKLFDGFLEFLKKKNNFFFNLWRLQSRFHRS